MTSKQIDDFHEAIDLLLSSVDVVQKKHDRKKERYDLFILVFFQNIHVLFDSLQLDLHLQHSNT